MSSRGLARAYELRPAASPAPALRSCGRSLTGASSDSGVAMESPDLTVIAARWQDLAEIIDQIADTLLQDGPEARGAATMNGLGGEVREVVRELAERRGVGCGPPRGRFPPRQHFGETR